MNSKFPRGVGITAVVLLAFLLREWVVLATHIDAPIRGDINQYVAYAWNLVHHQTFSMAAIDPTATSVPPDAFRGPGYPLFLAAAMLAGGTDGGWYMWTLQAQVLLGTATVALTVLLGRLWLAEPWALAAGALAAIWPHHVVASGTLLSEVLFGFLIIAGLWLAARASAARRGTGWAVLAGGAFALGWLVNPVLLFFPAVAALLLWASGRRREATLVVLLPILAAGGWSLRNAQLPEEARSANRAVINFVQGSWPIYHEAWNARLAHADAREIMDAIVAEQELFASDAQAGLRSMAERFAHDPAYYARWYFWTKPYLLWDWSIRVGAGGIYFHRVEHAPFDRNPVLGATRQLLRMANPALFLLAAAAALLLLLRARPRLEEANCGPLLVASFFLYVTAVHWVFQAEPRYAIPYRPEQMLLAVSALACITDALARHLPLTRRVTN